MTTHYEIARSSAGMADRSTRGTVEVHGDDRLAFLHSLLTNDIAALSPGSGCYAAWLTPQGRMITDMRVLALEGRIALDVRAADAAALAHRLDRLVFAEQVQVRDASATALQTRILGPLAPEVVAEALAAAGANASAPAAADLAGWPEYRSAGVQAGGAELVVVRDNGLGVPAFDVYAGPDQAGALRAALEARGLARLDEAAIDTLRIEAGRPAFGVDMDTETIPLEAGIEERAISYTKGCYVGQEVIVRVTTRGHGRVARRLVGLVVEGDRVPARGETLRAGDREVGHVTSATWSPALGRPIALGYVQRDFSAPAATIAVGADATAMVTPLPFRA